jgi:hypothetical protein
VTRRLGNTLSFGNVAAALRETWDISICSSRAQAGDQMALEPEDVPDRDGFFALVAWLGVYKRHMICGAPPPPPRSKPWVPSTCSRVRVGT